MGLRTVKVPDEFAALFLEAEGVVSRYFRDRVDSPERGTIEIFGERYVLVRAASLSVEFFSLMGSLYGAGREAEGEEFARTILFDLAHTIGESDARNFHAKMGLEDPISRLSAGPIHFAHSGWAFVDIFPESTAIPGPDYYLIYDHPYSFESDAWIRSGKPRHAPVCVMNAGYSSGWCQESFGIPLTACEILCSAKGDDCCRFIMAPPERIAAHVERYIAAHPELEAQIRPYRIQSLFARQRFEEELRLRQNELEAPGRRAYGRATSRQRAAAGRDGRARPGRGALTANRQDPGDRQAGRRSGTRLQQPADCDHGLHHAGAGQAREQ